VADERDGQAVNVGVRIAAVVMLVPGAIWSGVIVAGAVERISLWNRMPVVQYAVDFRRTLYRLDPLLPILGAISMVAAIVFALKTKGAAEALAWVGIAQIVFVIVWSVTLMEPLNSRFRRLPEGSAPDDAERIRTVWRWRHFVRTAPAVGALVCLAIAVTYA
jgi:Domain of unknown function (DUF1772)